MRYGVSESVSVAAILLLSENFPIVRCGLLWSLIRRRRGGVHLQLALIPPLLPRASGEERLGAFPSQTSHDTPGSKSLINT